MSPLQIAKECLANQSKHVRLNAFISRASQASILARASAAQDVAPGHWPPHGQLIAIKDNICTTDFPTTAASGTLKNFTSPYDATVVKLLRDAGAIIAGKTNMDEFGMGSHSIHSHFGAVRHEEEEGTVLSAGGSSGGSAVAVSSGQCTAALGTDTGGSVRLPAAYTSIVGFKPSYGLLSRWGVIAYANSLDTVGIIAEDVETTKHLFMTLNKYDSQDPTSLPPSTRARLGATSGFNSDPRHSQRPLRIGIPLEYNISDLHPDVKATWKRALDLLELEGHTLHPVSLPNTRHALSAYYILAPAEASSNLAKYDGVRYGTRADGPDGTPTSVLFAQTRGANLGLEVQRRILLGAFSLSAQAIDNYFIQAQKIRRLVQQDFDRVFATPNPLLSTPDTHAEDEGVDVIISPTAPTPSPLLSTVSSQPPTSAYKNDVFTVPASLAGLPAINIPIMVPQGDKQRPASPSYHSKYSWRTLGVQIIGQYGTDDLVLEVAEALKEYDEAGFNDGEKVREVEEDA
ncbi:A subunit of putative glutamyl-tRNA amidotransferase [Aaosphaeria arxii CBS 175.79]|uniref:Glutamyl-tRNA(Gln) amidotransferase subunit A, mitochondrial n=1 Tax=Aaosphaeria arxii CBS 175.79 TaxID=1450172 RepID=A0A6A5Y251_9PLEO|nr:A subunit of putative glutamyl-tRNA amidotransferase [Aaosphaeria arxii CBS 175.79]KAF2019548.1 A subunit of putative glutamyl-tRNA amidotransferase [Aaosphaeria arxii CBS 175.79]